MRCQKPAKIGSEISADALKRRTKIRTHVSRSPAPAAISLTFYYRKFKELPRSLFFLSSRLAVDLMYNGGSSARPVVMRSALMHRAGYALYARR